MGHFRHIEASVNTSTRGGGLKCEPLKADCCEPPAAAVRRTSASRPANNSSSCTYLLSSRPATPCRSLVVWSPCRPGGTLTGLFAISAILAMQNRSPALDATYPMNHRIRRRNQVGLRPVPFSSGHSCICQTLGVPRLSRGFTPVNYCAGRVTPLDERGYGIRTNDGGCPGRWGRGRGLGIRTTGDGWPGRADR